MGSLVRVPELLDVFASDGTTHLGVRDRAEVHRDGHWHLAFHLWVVTDAGVILQRRASDKDSWPGHLDATAAGHLTAGERIADGLREADEELGVTYRYEQLTPLGVFRVDEALRPGFHNREHQHVFAIRDERPLDAWDAWDRVELDGLVLVDHPAFAELLVPGASIHARAWDGVRVRDRRIGHHELVPAPYLREIAPLLADLSGS
jgi:isopentenyldiphosphate isomerase